MRLYAQYIIEHRLFTWCIVLLILINALTLGMETSQHVMAIYGHYLGIIDMGILLIFTAELLVKLYVYKGRFFTSAWNIFDIIIVTIAWLPTSGVFAVLRALRILRVLRLISVVPQMRRVVGAIGYSIPGMVSVIGVLILIFYVAAVMATKLFGHNPNPDMQEWFGSISASAYTLFQIMTLESWSMGVVRPTMVLFPWAWVFFIPFIIITSFAVLNFFIGIIVDSMQMVQKLDDEAHKNDADAPMTKQDYATLMTELQHIKKTLHHINTKK